MDEKWCCTQLENLKIQENRLSALFAIHVRLNESTNLQLETLVTNRLLRSPEIYDCLEDCNVANEQSELAIDILSICISQLSIDQSDLPALLERALTHQRPRIRAIALNTILKQLQFASEEQTITISDELLLHVLNGLQHDEAEVGVPSMGILSLVLETRLDQPIVKEKLSHMLSANETIRSRVYELAVNLAKRSPTALEKVQFLLDRALSELDNEDVLLQVNILELLVSLAKQNHGLVYLEKRQVFDLISRRVESSHLNPLDQLLIPGIIKFFGKAASVQPEKIINGYPVMVQCLFDSLLSEDISLLPVALDTLANVLQSNQGKILMEKNYSAMLKETFELIKLQLRNLPTDLKNRTFNTLEMIFGTDNHISNEIDALLNQWFNYLAVGGNMQFLMEFCRNPFADIKVACFALVKSLCLHKWGIVALKNTAGFVEYLLDRKIEFDKEAKYGKFDIICLLANSDIFDVQTTLQLRTYVNEGPYFVQSIMDVAVEGN